jgi:hypothetical protein
MATATLQMNDENDLFLPDGRNLVVLNGAPACLQDILSKTRMRLGEDIYNVKNGVDYLGTIFTPQPNDGAARKSLIDNIKASPDVLSVDQLNVTIRQDVFNYEAQVVTIYGLETLRG